MVGSGWSIGFVPQVLVWAEPLAAFYTLDGAGRLATWGNTGGSRVALVPDTGTPLWQADSGNGFGGFLFDQSRPDTLKSASTLSVSTWCAWLLYKDLLANQTVILEHGPNAGSSDGFWVYSDTLAHWCLKSGVFSKYSATGNWGSIMYSISDSLISVRMIS